MLKKTDSLLTQRNLKSKAPCRSGCTQLLPALFPCGRLSVQIPKGDRTNLMPATLALLLFFLQCCFGCWESESSLRDVFSRDGALLSHTQTRIWAGISAGPVWMGACSCSALGQESWHWLGGEKGIPLRALAAAASTPTSGASVL